MDVGSSDGGEDAELTSDGLVVMYQEYLWHSDF